MGERSGKIASQTLEQSIFKKRGYPRPEVRVGPKSGVDVSIVDLPGGMALALTSDPLTLIPSLGLRESAWMSVHLMANDMATTGVGPMYGQFVLNLPPSLSKEEFKMYWEYIHNYCASINVAITGGHTCFIEGQHSTVAGGGTFIAVAPRQKLLVSAAALAGNAILVTKTCGLSASAILAMCFPQTVINGAGMEIYQSACASFYNTSALEDALVAVDADNDYSGVTAMHDVTEGGVFGAIWELAVASGNGVVVDKAKLPVSDVQEKICQLFKLDPRHCIGAGAMIIACEKKSVNHIIARLSNKNIPCVEVGRLCDKEEGIQVIENGKKNAWQPLPEDPYWAAFFHASKMGWR